MDLWSGIPMWPALFPTPTRYGAIAANHDADVVILGGGEAGALCTWFLTQAGFRVVVLERHQIASGSTSANTGLIQFSNDMPLSTMTHRHGQAEAVNFYRLCLDAINDLAAICGSLSISPEFTRRNSLYYASRKRDVIRLRDEYRTLRQHGFPVEFLDEVEIRERLPFSKPAALLTFGDAEVNPYRLTHAIFDDVIAKRSAKVFENSEVVNMKESASGVTVKTAQDFSVRAKVAIVATGYEAQDTYGTPGGVIGSTYAIATEPIPDLSDWTERSLIWETHRPYLYLRTTPDERIIIGGLDEKVVDGLRRDEKLLPNAEKLRRQMVALFPMYADAEIAYRWAGTFGSSVDGMPFVGRHPHYKHVLFALGYGGNGTVYYTLTGRILQDVLRDGDHPAMKMLNPDRLRWYRVLGERVGQLFGE